jgi:hypothetical protein
MIMQSINFLNEPEVESMAFAIAHIFYHLFSTYITTSPLLMFSLLLSLRNVRI